MELIIIFHITNYFHGQFVETQGVNDGVNHDLDMESGEFELYMVKKTPFVMISINFQLKI
jgi:hypothetical protein